MVVGRREANGQSSNSDAPHIRATRFNHVTAAVSVSPPEGLETASCNRVFAAHVCLKTAA